MFSKILIANRGEIACRVIRTARKLNIATVAVYSEADADALHVRMADEAVCIGPAPAADSYLRGEVILAAARRTGAEAIHPGYGFLSENAAFAEACAAAGVVFIGPPPQAIRVMGSKSESKRLMSGAAVPLVPGYHGTDQSDALLTAEAERIGYPVLVKASAGGGGKGMRIVRAAAGLADALAGARREAKAAFGDDNLLLEKYLTRPRHVEIQVFADTHGQAVHLFERDCSVQRRHQKVVEEAPAPALATEVRQSMGAAAVAAAQAIGYVGAGTVEFLYEDGAFYFIEMNTRLQVEHPVTEAITGQDLVEWQLRVAGGAPLPEPRQERLTCTGHAFEVRLYAEDPSRDFLPAIGRLIHIGWPQDETVRIDTGVRSGDAVSMHYDPMIAKIIVHGENRLDAVRRMRRALARTAVVGVTTNLAFLQAIFAEPAFAAEAIDTGFIERHRATLLPAPQPVPARGLVLATLAVLQRRLAESQAAARASGDPHSPWRMANGWRLNEDTHNDLRFFDAGTAREVTVHFRRSGWDIVVDGGPPVAVRRAEYDGQVLTAEIDGGIVSATVIADGLEFSVLADGQHWRLLLDDPWLRAADQEGAPGGRLTAPMPGTVVRVLVDAGARVARGTPLLVLEAMKMEHTITAPADGVVVSLTYRAGDQVADGAALLVFEAEDDSRPDSRTDSRADAHQTGEA